MKKIFRITTVPISLNGLFKGQLKMLNQHFDLVGVSSPGPALEEVHKREGIRVIAVPMERHISLIKDFISLIRMIILFLKEKPDMIHSYTPKAGLMSMLAGWIVGVPIRMHTFTGLIFPTAMGLKQKILILTDRLTCACATHINPEGYGVKKDLIKYHITKKTLKVIANGNVNGIDLEYFQRTAEVEQAAFPYKKEDVFTFCFVGRIVKDKGINELVYSFIKLLKYNPNIRLLLIGRMEDKLDPIDDIVKVEIETCNAIEYFGEQSDVRPFYEAADVFVFPSYREGFPNVVLEAGAMGIPSIVTNINGSNEIIKNGWNGVVIPSRDISALYEAMLMMLNNKKLKEMGKHARKNVQERFDSRLVWSEILKYYNTILS